jgi:hypothetical protein
MLQKYDISMNNETNRLSIKEFAVIGRISQKGEFYEPAKEEYSLLHKVTYDGDIIRAAVNEGKEALISELRSDDFFPIRSCAEIIADRVIQLFEDNPDLPDELFFDDKPPVFPG